jgi:hypothetical protein
MNSKERRKHKRAFPSTCIWPIFPTIDELIDIKVWCNNQFGQKNWSYEYANYWPRTFTFKFKDEKHMVWFLMKWS